MQKKEGKSVVAIFKKHITIITVLISSAVIAVLFLLLMNLRAGHKYNILINVLGRQRMLTQVMAKDTNRVYELYSALKGYSSEQEGLELKSKLSLTLQELRKTEAEYRKQYETIKLGYIISDGEKISFKGALPDLGFVLEEHEKIWPVFKDSIDYVLNETENSQRFFDGINYISENNDRLLEYSNEITSIVLDYNNHRNMALFYTIAAFFTLALILLIIFFIKTYKNLLLPVNQLYKGMAEAGITGMDIKGLQTGDKEPVFSEVRGVFDKLNSLILLIENLNKNIPFKDILNYIFESFSEYIPYTHIGVALLEDNGSTIRASYGVSNKNYHNFSGSLIGYKTDIKKTSLYEIVESGKERIINDLEEYVKGRPATEYNKILLHGGIRSSITFPLRNNRETVGIIFFSSNAKNVYKEEHVRFLRTLANSIMLGLEGDILIDDMIISSTLSLATLTEQRDTETGEHLKRMSIYSKMLAEFLSARRKYRDTIDVDYINNVERFSPLHDIGKVAIRDDILLKPGRLTFEELEIMKTHTLYGARVLKIADENIQKRGRSIFGMGIEIAEGHHEKWDGSGYPHGKKGEEIPLSARIVAIGDVFDALTSKRPYKKPFSFEESIGILTEGSGKHFDPEIIDALMENIDKVKEKYEEFKVKGIL